MEKSSVAIVHNEPVSPEDSYSEASRDILDQVEAVDRSLASLGMPSTRVAFTRDLRSFLNTIEEEGIRYAFNLCESVGENPKLTGHPASVMDVLGVSYTGSSALALEITTDKLLTKKLLRAHGISTPRYAMYDGTSPLNLKVLRFPLIVKPRFQDGSVGIDQRSIFLDEKELKQRLLRFYNRFGSLILEEYIAGREFNISVFGYPSPRVMPIAEISFNGFPEELYPIVGYKAKWDRNSFEYHHTRRVFPLDLPEILTTKIRRIAMDCFRHFMLRDYARVDIRVDHTGVVYVLEVNANPCISPDAGFPAALAHAGIAYEEFVKQLITFALRRKSERDSLYH